MLNVSPEKMKEIINRLCVGNVITESNLLDLTELANAWEVAQQELNTRIDKLLHTPVGYVDPTTLLEFEYSNVISGRIYANGDHKYTPMFTKDQLDDIRIYDSSSIDIAPK